MPTLHRDPNPNRKRGFLRERLVLFHVAAKGWINVQIKSLSAIQNHKLKTKYKPRDDEPKNMDGWNFEI